MRYVYALILLLLLASKRASVRREAFGSGNQSINQSYILFLFSSVTDTLFLRPTFSAFLNPHFYNISRGIDGSERQNLRRGAQILDFV
jgi:hypothetical protein